MFGGAVQIGFKVGFGGFGLFEGAFGDGAFVVQIAALNVPCNRITAVDLVL